MEDNRPTLDELGDMAFAEIILVGGLSYYETMGKRMLLDFCPVEFEVYRRGVHLLDRHDRLSKYMDRRSRC